MQARRFAVIGDPIEHSLSPAMHAAALAAADLDAIYEAVRVPAGNLAQFIGQVRAGLYDGLNVTIPHKAAVLPLLDEIDGTARALDAVNTVIAASRELVGYNTDPLGFREALSELRPLERHDAAIVFGAGGAARAVVHVLVQEGVSVTVVNRSHRDWSVHSRMSSRPLRWLMSTSSEVATAISGADIVVNATPLGMSHLPGAMPVRQEWRPKEGAVMMDLVYGRTTPFLRWAHDHGCRAVDGTSMLVYQGAAAFRLFTGSDPDVGIMRRACLARIHGRYACFAS